MLLYKLEGAGAPPPAPTGSPWRENMKDLINQTFGDLYVVVRYPENTSYGAARWVCRCSCDGHEVIASSKDLRSGQTQSCGHRRITEVRKANIRHGKKLTPEYIAYSSAKNRCCNPRCEHCEARNNVLELSKCLSSVSLTPA